jgi:hypothetical protein
MKCLNFWNYKNKVGCGSKLTAGDIQVAGLFVERKQGQVHWAGAGQRDSDAVQHIAIGKHSNVQIGLKINYSLLLSVNVNERRPFNWITTSKTLIESAHT